MLESWALCTANRFVANGKSTTGWRVLRAGPDKRQESGLQALHRHRKLGQGLGRQGAADSRSGLGTQGGRLQHRHAGDGRDQLAGTQLFAAIGITVEQRAFQLHAGRQAVDDRGCGGLPVRVHAGVEEVIGIEDHGQTGKATPWQTRFQVN